MTASGPGKCVAIPADLSEFDECVRLADELQKREEGEMVRYYSGEKVWC